MRRGFALVFVREDSPFWELPEGRCCDDDEDAAGGVSCCGSFFGRSSGQFQLPGAAWYPEEYDMVSRILASDTG